MKEVARAVFSGPGAVVIQLLILGLGAWIGETFCNATGKGQLGQFIRITTIFVAITIMFTSLFKALQVAGEALGLY